MNTQKIRILVISLMFFIIAFATVPVNAGSLKIDDVWKQGAGFLEDGKDEKVETFDGPKMQSAIMSLYKIAIWIAIAITVIIATYLGIQFITQGTEGKAKVKEAIVPFIVGVIVIFGSFTIWRVAMELFGQVEKVEMDAKIESVQEYKIA